MARAQRWVIRGLTTICMLATGPAADAQAVSRRANATHVSETAAVAVPDITGTWEGAFRVDSVWRLPNRPTARAVRARLQFSPVGDATPSTSSTRSVHAGTFEIDFSRFGFTLSTREALGWSVNPDSLRAVLNPTVDHGLVEIHGTIRGDSIVVGTWRYNADPGGARGTFELRRTNRR